MAYILKWCDHVFRLKYSGDITTAEVFSALAEFYGDGRASDITIQIIDSTDATDLEISEVDITGVAAQGIGSTQYIPVCKIYYITDNEKIITAIKKWGEIMGMVDHDWSFDIFPSVNKLKDYLKDDSINWEKLGYSNIQTFDQSKSHIGRHT